MNKQTLKDNSVQQTLCIPLWGRMIAAKKYPDLFPDKDAERIVRELGVDLSGKLLYKFQYAWMNCLIRQYNLSCEINGYLASHPNAAVAELGAGLSCLRRQMGNEKNPWYNLDMENVIDLRARLIPSGRNEHSVVCDLNDFSWFGKINFRPEDGIVFTGGGLFYYFKKEQVRRLFTAMADYFPGGIIAFDAVNAIGLKGVNAEVKMAGCAADSFFFMENPKNELEGWSDKIVGVKQRPYMDGYLKGGYEKTLITRLFSYVMNTFHIGYMVHAEFKK